MCSSDLDDYDNSLGAKPDPKVISADGVTDKAMAWIGKQRGKWFLWCHYIDPHGHYVAHPDGPNWGTEAEDLYDGELHFTDKHIGRLLDFLRRDPVGARTVIVLTSDHGDGFREHGFINHGMALYRELLHVPLIVYVPDVTPRRIPGPASPLDLFPTIADLAGADVTALGLEGDSLVPQLFYGRDARARVVFAETNYPESQRAAISSDYKLIYNLRANVYQLFDLRVDSWEKQNLWGKDVAGGRKMKAVLDEWLDRVYFSRDPTSQAQQQRADWLLPGPPSPEQRTNALAAGAIQIVGWDLETEHPAVGQDLRVTVYYDSVAVTEQILRLELEAFAEVTSPKPQRHSARQDRVPAEGRLPTSRWRPGEHLKETFGLRIPGHWPATKVTLAARLLDDKGQPVRITGPNAASDGKAAHLGTIELGAAPAKPVKPAAPVPSPLGPPGPVLAPAPTGPFAPL